MKAFRLHGIGDFRLEDCEKPVPEKGEVLVKVKAAGICGSDIPRIYRTGAYHHPMTPGHEFSGQVVEVGEGASSDWQGKRVGIFPLIPCMECSSCKKRQYEMCKKYNYLGSRTDGGFAEYVRVPEWNLIALPENVSFEQAAMLEPMSVAVHSLRKIGLLDEEGRLSKEAYNREGSMKTVAVCGLGTIGLFLTMFLIQLGMKDILVIGNKDFQKKTVVELGVDEQHFCDLRKQNPEEWLTEKTKEEGVDFFFECVGKNEVLLQGINGIAPGGHLLLLGNPAGDVALEKNVYWKLLRKQVQVQGTWNSSFTHEEKDDWHYVVNCLADGSIHSEKMITHRFSIEDFQRGFEIMRDKSEDYIKVMGIM